MSAAGDLMDHTDVPLLLRALAVLEVPVPADDQRCRTGCAAALGAERYFATLETRLLLGHLSQRCARDWVRLVCLAAARPGSHRGRRSSASSWSQSSLRLLT